MGIVRIGEDLWDEETGEYAGPVDGALDATGVQTEDDLLVFMRRLLRYESDVAAAKAELQTIIANAEKIIVERERKRDWWLERYEQQAKHVADSLLPRKADGSYASKTHKTPFGTISFVTRGQSVAINDAEGDAIAWAEQNVPEAVKVTKKVLISQLPTKEWIAEGRCPSGFVIEDGYTIAKIKTLDKDV